MSLFDWILLAVVLAVGVAACVFVARLKQKGHAVPGKMCAGCCDLRSLGMELEDGEKSDQ